MGSLIAKIFWLFTLVLLMTFQLSAQEVQPDIIWMHNGEKLEGKLIIPTNGDELKLVQIQTGDTLDINRKDIDRIEQYVAFTSRDIRKQQRDQWPTLFSQKRFYGILQIMAGGGSELSSIWGGGIRGGYRFPVGLELGLAAHYYGIDSGWGEGIIPVGLDARFPLFKSKTGRFLSLLQLNTGIAFSDPYDVFNNKYGEHTFRADGYFYQTGIALRVNINRYLGLIFDICYLNINTPKISSKTKNNLGRDQEGTFLASVGLNF